ncbi:MAG: chromosome segregation protein SMC [Gemmatimonadetes bacterium]|nr:chromosome segregation protein SMC [Gemmatimonadota bacterium]
MRLTRLEMHGFKSFADLTDMVFDEGVTAIVGPNGCGKSNVSDAVRWVLGEQRARLLRGAKMEEVIFQGSSARRAVNVAEVSLFFANDDGALPVPFQEVVITRRLSRSGESEYFLNRAACRLRDIHDLVRGTGLGADSGVVIESRMIDSLLSDRPDERRELFEEAAGIGLYRDRRRSTERRLEETVNDLARLDDLIGEVQSQTRSLARQRRRAERHAELTERRFGVELTLAAREMEAWKDELAALDARVRELRNQVPVGEKRVHEVERQREQAHGARAAAEAGRAELARLVADQRTAVATLQGEIAVAQERHRNAESRRMRAEEERQEGAAAGARVSRERDEAVRDRAACEAALASGRSALAEATAAEEQARAALAAARAAVEHADASVRSLQDEQRRVLYDRDAAHRESGELAQRLAALDDERARLADAEAAVHRERALVTDAIAMARERVAAAALARETARAAAREARERDAAARGAFARATESHTALEGKASALEALERERVGLAPAAAHLLRERDTFGAGAVLGPLSDFLSASSDAAAMVERYLGASVHAVVVRDHAAADAVRAWHARTNPGPLLLLPLDAAPGGTDAAGSLVNAVSAADPARAWVRALLGQVRSVDNGASFVDARGAVWLPGGNAGAGPLRRRAELFALRAELEASARARDEALRTAELERTAAESAEVGATAADDAHMLAQHELRREEERLAEVGRRLERAERELADAAELAARLTARRAELEERAATATRRAGALDADQGTALLAVAAAREHLGAAERTQDSLRDARTERQVAEAHAQARLQVAADREARLTQEQATTAQRLEQLALELASIAETDGALARQMADWTVNLESRQGQLGDAERRLSDAELAVSTADASLADAEHLLEETRRANMALADELHHDELRLTTLGGRRAAIRERLETEWRKPLEDLMAALVPLDLDSEALRTEADALRQQLEQLGVVNPLAIEEHEEELRRLDFLTTQRNDLSDARAALGQAIREIDATARELFLATFAQVRENFRHIFMTLFGGGECDLRLENPETPLDGDIEIHASPRGKRTQRIHLLSSGERALVALSLLFGIFLTKPSPFCLLDEVDAPLDDNNIGRFVRMLNEFKSRTQFIVITHNPRTTTEAADAVYGVTMQEPGVSSLVSVRMKGAAVEEEAVAVGAA